MSNLKVGGYVGKILRVDLSSGKIGTDANLIAPGKRMISSTSPTIVKRDGKVVLLTAGTEDRVHALVRLDSLNDIFLYVGRPVDPRVLAQRPDAIAGRHQAVPNDSGLLSHAARLIAGL